MVNALHSIGMVVLLCLGGAATRPAAPTREEQIPEDPRQEAALLRLAGDGFAIKQTPHFIVAYNSERAVVDDFTARIEQTYRAVYRFCELNKIESHRPRARLEAIFFNDRSGYSRYGASLHFPFEGTCGVYSEGTNRSAFVNVRNDPEMLQLHASIAASRENLDELTRSLEAIKGRGTRIVLRSSDGRSREMSKAEAQRELDDSRRKLRSLDARRMGYAERINQTVVQHEVAHQVLFNAGVHSREAANPKWIIEGLACMFEPPPDQMGTGIGTVNQLRLRDFRTCVAGAAKGSRLSADDVLEAVAAGRMIDLRKLVSDPTLFNERGERGAMIYAATWALAHYLQRSRPEQFGAYLRELSKRGPTSRPSGPDETSLFEKHFGPLDQAFVRRWGEYVLKLTYRPPPGST